MVKRIIELDHFFLSMAKNLSMHNFIFMKLIMKLKIELMQLYMKMIENMWIQILLSG